MTTLGIGVLSLVIRQYE